MKTKLNYMRLANGSPKSFKIECETYSHQGVDFAIATDAYGDWIAFEVKTGYGFGVGNCESMEECLRIAILRIEQKGKLAFEKAAENFPVINS